MHFVIAILLCIGDNCDLAHPEPNVTYDTYEQCSQATATKANEFNKFIAAQSQQQGRDTQILCLRDTLQITELDEEHEALVDTDVRETPEARHAAVQAACARRPGGRPSASRAAARRAGTSPVSPGQQTGPGRPSRPSQPEHTRRAGRQPRRPNRRQRRRPPAPPGASPAAQPGQHAPRFVRLR